MSYFFFLYWSPSLSLWTAFDSISSNIDEVLSINPSTNVFVFGVFNVHQKDCLTYSGGTDRPGELYYNFSISSDLTQIVNFPTWIPDCDSCSLALLYLFLSSDVSIYSLVAFPPMGNYDHVVVSIPIDFPSNSKWDAFFYHMLMTILVLMGQCVIIWKMFHGRISLNSVHYTNRINLLNLKIG